MRNLNPKTVSTANMIIAQIMTLKKKKSKINYGIVQNMTVGPVQGICSTE